MHNIIVTKPYRFVPTVMQRHQNEEAGRSTCAIGELTHDIVRRGIPRGPKCRASSHTPVPTTATAVRVTSAVRIKSLDLRGPASGDWRVSVWLERSACMRTANRRMLR